LSPKTQVSQVVVRVIAEFVLMDVQCYAPKRAAPAAPWRVPAVAERRYLVLGLIYSVDVV